ncbi:hypothetical protein CPB83DRAFT_257719 [Crepidotus variabilis]|uniref:Uncharacterized protein n=1 Tax=Crepidotus variabilis TaxID=179855 RepID=A0A9P6EH73_9AGAR|nr:hypothetical protein CPB83DRAFT_257719 [Crepidotus variabilis]
MWYRYYRFVSHIPLLSFVFLAFRSTSTISYRRFGRSIVSLPASLFLVPLSHLKDTPSLFCSILVFTIQAQSLTLLSLSSGPDLLSRQVIKPRCPNSTYCKRDFRPPNPAMIARDYLVTTHTPLQALDASDPLSTTNARDCFRHLHYAPFLERACAILILSTLSLDPTLSSQN